jgi:hypothetical protein
MHAVNLGFVLCCPAIGIGRVLAKLIIDAVVRIFPTRETFDVKFEHDAHLAAGSKTAWHFGHFISVNDTLWVSFGGISYLQAGQGVFNEAVTLSLSIFRLMSVILWSILCSTRYSDGSGTILYDDNFVRAKRSLAV